MNYKKIQKSIIWLLMILLLVTGCAHPSQEESAKIDEVVENKNEVETENALINDQPQKGENANDPQGEKEESSTEVHLEDKQDVSNPSEDTVSQSPGELGTDGKNEKFYFSVEELVGSVNLLTENNVQSADTLMNTDTLSKHYNHFYVPALLPSNYVLEGINVSKTEITYYYQPSDVPYSYKNLIKFIYKNPDQVTTENPLDMLVARDKTDVTEDDLLYLPQYREINFTVGDSWMSIVVPESMNTYEQLKPLCVATRYEVNQNDNTVTE